MENINKLESLKKYIIIGIIFLVVAASVFIAFGKEKESDNSSEVNNNIVHEIKNTSWSGEYSSNGDKLTGTLEFSGEGTALFSFELKNKDKTTVTGSYTMKVEEFHEKTGYIYLTGLKWEEQPADLDWNSNKLQGAVSQNYLVGTVISNRDNRFVGAFEFEKVK